MFPYYIHRLDWKPLRVCFEVTFINYKRAFLLIIELSVRSFTYNHRVWASLFPVFFLGIIEFSHLAT